MTHDRYAPAPAGAAPMTGPDDHDIARLDAEAEASNHQVWLQQQIAKKADDLRILDAARARLRAEQVAHLDYTDHYLSRSQLLDLPTPDPLIERVLPRHGYGILRGRDQSLKSFTAIDWACCLATGKPWQGRRSVQVPVLYIAGEGAHGLASRVEAWEYAWGHLVPDTHLTIRKTALDLHTPGPAFDQLLEHVHTRGYGLVIVDTLRRVSGAADGNTSEMGRVVDNLDRIKHATADGTVLAVAHTDKGDHDTRGYSGIEDDADFVWAAKRDDDHLTLELTKMKDGADGITVHLTATRTLRSLTLTGTDGKPETNTNQAQLAILDALRIIPTDTATGNELRTTAGLAKATFYRALSDLRDSGQIITHQTGRTKHYALPAAGLDNPASDPNDTGHNHADTPLDQEDQ